MKKAPKKIETLENQGLLEVGRTVLIIWPDPLTTLYKDHSKKCICGIFMQRRKTDTGHDLILDTHSSDLIAVSEDDIEDIHRVSLRDQNALRDVSIRILSLLGFCIDKRTAALRPRNGYDVERRCTPSTKEILKAFNVGLSIGNGSLRSQT